MKIAARLAVVLALAAMLPACAKVLNRNDPVNTLQINMPIGGSTNATTNPLLRPPGYQQPANPR